MLATKRRIPVTLVHKYHEVHRRRLKDWKRFRSWRYFVLRWRGELIDGGPWLKIKNPNTGSISWLKTLSPMRSRKQILPSGGIILNAVAFVATRGERHHVSDAPLVAQAVGGIGYCTGCEYFRDECALLEATHGLRRNGAGQINNPVHYSGSAGADAGQPHAVLFEAADLIAAVWKAIAAEDRDL